MSAFLLLLFNFYALAESQKQHYLISSSQSKQVMMDQLVAAGIETELIPLSNTARVLLDEKDILNLQKFPGIDEFEPDYEYEAAGQEPEILTQRNAPWGLARISQRDTEDSNYIYPATAGSGVDIYVLDSGVDAENQDLRGKVIQDANFVIQESIEDWFGHGTHVSGILVGNFSGVAKKATLRSVKILDQYGKTNASTIIKGIGYAINATLERRVPSIINLSFSGPRSAAVNAMIRVAVQNNITVVGSGGNDGEDACLHTPASEPMVLAVGAITRKDTIARYSNVGPCIDIFAPGDKISSTYLTREGKRHWSRKKMSGSSMSAPFVTGVAAILLSLNTSMTPRDLRLMIQSMATMDKLKTTPNNTVNAIVYTGSFK